MALQSFSIIRAQDPADPNAKLVEIVPRNWHRFPGGVPAGGSPPIYVRTNTWNGGVYGDDQILAKTNVLVDEQGRGDYTPRNQDDKAVALGKVIVTDVARGRGPIDPAEPYPTAASAPEPPPVITSLSPNTAVAGSISSPVVTTVTGTAFTPWTKLIVGNIQTPYYKYISSTRMLVYMDAARSVPGVVTVIAWDHGVSSAPSNFTFT